MVKMSDVVDPLAVMQQAGTTPRKDVMAEDIRKAKRQQGLAQGKEALESRGNYLIKITGRAKAGTIRTKAMTFEITPDLEEALRELVAQKKEKDKTFNKSVAIRNGIALYLSQEKFGKKRKGAKDGTGKDSSTEKSD